MIKSLLGWRAAALVVIGAAAVAAPAQAEPAGVPEAHIAVPAGARPAAVQLPAQAAPAAQRAQSTHQPSGSGSSAVNTSGCTQQTFSQPFAAFGDHGSYTLMPGEGVDNFTATGWTLTHGAHVVQTTLKDGTTGSVLDVPSGSSAVSPPMCVAVNYPTARTMIRDVSGAAGLQFLVSYKGSRSWANPRHTGFVHANSKAWSLSFPFRLQPARTPGWQIVRFKLVATGHRGEYQLYNTYVDPHWMG